VTQEEIRLPTYETLLTEAIRSLAVDSGVVTSPATVGTNVLHDDTKNWAAGAHKNRLVKIIRGSGAGQMAVIESNTARSLVIKGSWAVSLDTTSVYVILSADFAQILRDVFGGGSDISAANPLPVDISPGLKTTQGILTLAALAAGATSTLANCTAVDLRHGPSTLAITVTATYNGAATRGLRVHIRTSPDNIDWDTEDWDVWDAGFTAGATVRETEHYDTDPMYLKVLIENLDAAQALTNITVTASIGA